MTPCAGPFTQKSHEHSRLAANLVISLAGIRFACLELVSIIPYRSRELSMNVKSTSLGATALALAAFCFVGSAAAEPVLCDDASVNHMYVDSTLVSACLGGGVGNINGNPGTDDFLTGEGAGLGLVGIGDGSGTQSGSSGTFSFDSSLWQSWGEIAIGFKFGTGNKPDEWFVYLLNPLVSSGNWQFVNVFDKGGGLSHVQLYGRGEPANVPEPATLALFGIGLLGAAAARRRKRI
jgi:hypothetical protein